MEKVRNDLLDRLCSTADLQLGRREILHLAELLSDDAFLARFHEKSGGNLSDTVAAILAHID
ncbi:MAG: hypothetical protein SGCHY_003537, partial [Lobulomycetales sp.]